MSELGERIQEMTDGGLLPALFSHAKSGLGESHNGTLGLLGVAGSFAQRCVAVDLYTRPVFDLSTRPINLDFRKLLATT